MNEAIYRVGMYTGTIYGPDIDPDTITECCRAYSSERIAKINSNPIYHPAIACYFCDGCPASQNLQPL